MNYTCPKCKTVCTLSEPPFQGGSTYECRCGERVRIPLYCPTCCPPKVANKEFLETDEGDLQGRSFRCGEGHTFTVPWTRDGSHARLSDFGSRIGDYDQMDQVGKLDVGLRTSVSKGFCSGVALDWIRRALLGRKTDPVLLTMKPRHRVRAATARVLLTSDRSQGFMDAQWETQKKATKADNERVDLEAQVLLDQNEARFDAAIDAINALGQKRAIDQTEAEERFREAERLRNQVEAEIKANLAASQERHNAGLSSYKSRSQVDRLWAHFAQTMDEHIRAGREQRAKAGPSPRPFSDLRIVKSVDTQEFAGTGKLCKILLAALPTNCAAYVSVRPALGQGDGHGIAILCTNAGVYRLFEPNLGTYEFKSAESLSNALKFLFREVESFEVGGKVNAAYTIFQGKEEPVAGVKALVHSQ